MVAGGNLDGRRAYGRTAHSAQHYSDHGEPVILDRWPGEVPVPAVSHLGG